MRAATNTSEAVFRCAIATEHDGFQEFPAATSADRATQHWPRKTQDPARGGVWLRTRRGHGSVRDLVRLSAP